jgi:hypothetical protein
VTAGEQNLLHQLRETVTRLAASADEQAAYLTELGVAPSADELALELDDLMRLVPQLIAKGYLDSNQEQALIALDHQLDDMSADTTLWTQTALATRGEWSKVRQLAEATLARLCS